MLPFASDITTEAIDAAVRPIVGRPYRRGGRGPDAFDCVGAFLAVFRAFGVELPDPADGPEAIEETRRRFDEIEDLAGLEPLDVVLRRGALPVASASSVEPGNSREPDLVVYLGGRRVLRAVHGGRVVRSPDTMYRASLARGFRLRGGVDG